MSKKITYKELKERQSWTLNQKIDHSLGVIDQFYNKLEGKVYVSFSGGKDSTVLLWLARRIFPDINTVFCNTRNEYPEIVRFVKSFANVEIIYPELKPKEVLSRYGFPLISKKTSHIIDVCKRVPNGKTYYNFILERNSRFSVAKKWLFLLSAKYNISSNCCDELKKKPFKKYYDRTGYYPITGEMAGDSQGREMKYLQSGGCNSFSGTVNSKPLSIWTEKDIWDIIDKYNIPISDIYKKGAKRTGCMFCGYGCQFKDDNRFQLVYDLYPKYYKMFLNYTNNGITYREVLRAVLAINGLVLPDENRQYKIDFQY